MSTTLRRRGRADRRDDLVDHRLQMKALARRNRDLEAEFFDGAGDDRPDRGDGRPPQAFPQSVFAIVLARDLPEAPELRRALVEATRAGYVETFAAWRAGLARTWRDAGAGFTEVVTDEPAEHAVRRIARDVQTVVAQPETRERLQATGAELFEDHQAGFRRFFLADIEKWRGVVKAANLKLE